jgi:exodeoxyribonuclease VII small subunit
MPKTQKSAPPANFESAIKELEELVADMESGRLTLEESLAAYKRGIELSAYCQKTLNAAEQQVKILENGALKDFDGQSPLDARTGPRDA